MTITAELQELNALNTESRTSHYSLNGITAPLEFRVPWLTRFADGPQIGDIYPEDDGIPLRLHCVDVKHKKVGTATIDGEVVDMSHVIAVYSSDQTGNFDTAESLSTNLEAFELAKGRTWVSDSATNSENIAVYIPTMTYNYKFSTPTFNLGTVLGFAGHVNSFPFLFGGVGQWVFLGSDSDTGRAGLIPYQGGFTQDAKYWTSTFHFQYSGIGWNNHWRSDIGAFDTLTEPVYPSADLRLLFL